MSKYFFRYAFMVAALSFCISNAAQGQFFHGHKGPEIDPGEAVAGVTLLAGSIAVLRARGGSKK